MPDEPFSDDHDSPWKEALERYFPDFLALLFPAVHAGVDWSRGHHFLDKELQQVVRDAEAGRRHADKLVSVAAADGTETWVLVHVEVQGTPEAAFAERMFTYHYRLLDRYARDVVSLAVLADASPGFRPSGYRRGRWGCELAFRFPVAKLLDWAEEPAWSRLEVGPAQYPQITAQSAPRGAGQGAGRNQGPRALGTRRNTGLALAVRSLRASRRWARRGVALS